MAVDTPPRRPAARRRPPPAAERSWQFDWAGPHGTAWGTVNAVLTVISVTSVFHTAMHPPRLPSWLRWMPWPATDNVVSRAWWVPLVAGILGLIAVLLRAALRTTRTPGVTVLYQAACCVGLAGWSTWMLHRAVWTWVWFVFGVGILAGLAVAAGILAALASDKPDDPAAAPADPEVAAAVRRQKKAVEWENRIARHLPSGRNDEVKPSITGIEQWQRGHGFTGEGHLPEGGIGLDDLRAIAPKLATDADLPHGCTVSFQPVPGGTRRQFLMDVMESNGMSDDEPYPSDITPLTINEPIPVGLRPNFDEVGPELRSRCMIVYGETGAGKTNYLHVTTAGLVRCVDVINMQIDLTGGGLYRPWLAPWLAGKTRRPAIGAVARTPAEAMRMCRAIKRIGYGRKVAYQDLMAQVDDDKLPIGHPVDDEHVVVEVMLAVDEIASITGSQSKWPDLRDLIVEIINELRASGCRVVLAGLRGTDEVVVQQIQAMCAVRAGLRVASKAELAWIFDWSAGLDPADIPNPGDGYIQLDSGSKPGVYHTYRLLPSRIGAIAVAADDWIPDLEPISRDLANGRNPDGSRMPGVLDEDLDWWEHRWDGWEADVAPMAVAAEPQIPPVPPMSSTTGAPDPGVAALIAGAEATNRELEDKIAQSQGLDPQKARTDRAEFERLMKQEGFGEQDWTDPGSWSAPPPAEEPPANGPDRMLEILRGAGDPGKAPKELLADLAGEGIVIHRDTLHDWLRKAAAAGQVKNRQHGRWVWIGGEQT